MIFHCYISVFGVPYTGCISEMKGEKKKKKNGVGCIVIILGFVFSHIQFRISVCVRSRTRGKHSVLCDATLECPLNRFFKIFLFCCIFFFFFFFFLHRQSTIQIKSRLIYGQNVITFSTRSVILFAIYKNIRLHLNGFLCLGR